MKTVGKWVSSVQEWVTAVFFHPDAVLVRRILHQLEDLRRDVKDLQTTRRGMMAKVEELEAELTIVKDIIAAERVEVQGKLTAFMTEIQALKDQIAAGGGVSEVQLDSVLVGLRDLKASISQISEPTA